MDITTRSDVDFLVRSFYTKVKADFMLGAIFNHVIPTAELWDHHYVTLIDFWDNNLLQGTSYTGNPVGLHLWVDNITQKKITEAHFNRWIELWHQTIDEKFEGKCAQQAKSRASSMGRTFHSRIMQVRKDIEESVKRAKAG